VPSRSSQQRARQAETAETAASLPSVAGALWPSLRDEAAQAAGERLLAPLMHQAILDRDGFDDSLAQLLGRKLGDAMIAPAAIAALAAETYRTEPDILEAGAADLRAVRERDPAAPDLATALLYFKGFQALQAHRVAHRLWVQHRRSLALHLQSRVSEIFGLDIHPAARIGRRVLIDHGTGIVIGETAVVDDDVSLLQGVTLGGTGKLTGDRHPKIRRGVLIGAGATVLGNIEIGEGAKVGAGSIVLEDVHPYTTVVGNPARVVGTRHVGMPALTMDQSLPPIDYMI
jgi:serine O-acetyltransferase